MKAKVFNYDRIAISTDTNKMISDIAPSDALRFAIEILNAVHKIEFSDNYVNKIFSKVPTT